MCDLSVMFSLLCADAGCAISIARHCSASSSHPCGKCLSVVKLTRCELLGGLLTLMLSGTCAVGVAVDASLLRDFPASNASVTVVGARYDFVHDDFVIVCCVGCDLAMPLCAL